MRTVHVSYVDKYIDWLKETPIIDEEDRKLFLAFIDECFVQGLSEKRIVFYATRMRTLAKKFYFKPIYKWTKQDIKKAVGMLERSPYTSWTKRDYKILIKKLIQFREGFEWASKEYPDEVKWLKTTCKDKIRLPEEILSEKEVERMVHTAKHIRNKAFIYTLYESGTRIGEILLLRIKDITFDDKGAILRVSGKTGTRRIRIVRAASYLEIWLRQHPNPHPNNYVWVGLSNTKHLRLSYTHARGMLRDIGKKANIFKSVNPHAFRHARATFLANHLTDAQLKIFFGWSASSKMAATYIHLSGRDVDDAILRLYETQPKPL